MKNKIGKIFCILAIAVILFSINIKTYAFSEIISDGKNFIQSGEHIENGDSIPLDPTKMQEEMQKTSGYLYNILLTAGVVVAVVVATVLGIQFMIGGAEGQAKVKEMLIPFVIGCIIVFGGFAIWKVALTVGKKLESAGDAKTSYVQVIEDETHIVV